MVRAGKVSSDVYYRDASATVATRKVKRQGPRDFTVEVMKDVLDTVRAALAAGTPVRPATVRAPAGLVAAVRATIEREDRADGERRVRIIKVTPVAKAPAVPDAAPPAAVPVPAAAPAA